MNKDGMEVHGYGRNAKILLFFDKVLNKLWNYWDLIL